MNSTAWLQVIGDAYVALAFDLSTFITDDSLVTLEKLRGQDFFDTHLEGLPEIICQGPFKLADEYLQREEHGYGMGIFNHILAQNNFSPTYRVIKEKIIFPAHLLDNVQFKDRFLPIWKRWNFYLRLSSNGIVTIILHPDSKGTSVELKHTNIPDDDFNDIVDGWDSAYFGALREFYQE